MQIWGLTARILIDTAQVAFDQKPEFEHGRNLGEEGMVPDLVLSSQSGVQGGVSVKVLCAASTSLSFAAHDSADYPH